MTRTIEQMVMSYAIKYNKLSELVRTQFNDSKYASSDKINIFIDVTKIARSVSKEMTDMHQADQFLLCASILNLCAHYKSFFNSGYGVSTNIFLMHSSSVFVYNKKHVKEYSYYGKPIRHVLVSLNLDMLSDICKFIPNVYYIETNMEASIAVCDISSLQEYRSIPSIFITKDAYNWQCPVITANQISIFVPVKYRGNDNSYIVNFDNIYERFCHYHNCKYNDLRLNPQLYSVLLAMTKVPERGLHQLMSITSAMKQIRSKIDQLLIPNSYIAPIPNKITDSDSLSGLFDGTNINEFEVRERLIAIDVYSQINAFRFMINVSSDMTYVGLVDMVDPAGIEAIDNKFFQVSKVDFGTLMA